MVRVNIHIPPAGSLAHQHHWAVNMAAGFRAHGIEPQIIEGFYPTDCDLAVFWSHHPRTAAIRDRQFNNGRHYLVAERGYLGDRKKWTSLGYDGQNGRADFLNAGSPADRFKRYKWQVNDWSPGSEYILLIGQVPTDSSLNGLNFKEWIRATREELERLQNLPVKFRPHPLTEGRHLTHHYEKAELAEDLAGAACVITYNSTAGVDAIMDGKPLISLDRGSMAWPVAGHKLADVLDPPMPDRTQWLHDLAYCQWTDKQIARGDAWDHLKEGPPEVSCEPAD